MSIEVVGRFFINIDLKFLYSYLLVTFLLSGFLFHIPDIWRGKKKRLSYPSCQLHLNTSSFHCYLVRLIEQLSCPRANVGRSSFTVLVLCPYLLIWFLSPCFIHPSTIAGGSSREEMEQRCANHGGLCSHCINFGFTLTGMRRRWSFSKRRDMV